MHHLSEDPHVVRIKGTYEDNVFVHIVMELCAGGELFDRIVQKGHYSERKAAGLIKTIVGVVEACHSLGVMHRDLKPENFLFDSSDEDAKLKTTDFGLSIFYKPAMEDEEEQGSTDFIGSCPEIEGQRFWLPLKHQEKEKQERSGSKEQQIIIYVWDAGRFSECFSDIVLGFGVNTMTLVMIIVLGITNRNAKGCGKIYLLEKVVLHIIAALGASVAFLDMIILLRDARNANSTPYHEGLFRGTQFLMWVTVLLVSKFGNWFGTFCNRILCFWWIMKPFMAIPFLRTVFSSHGLLLEGCRHSSKDMGRTIWIMLRPRLCIQYTSTTKLP